MNTFDGYIKRNGNDLSVLLNGGGDKPLSHFIGSISYNNNKMTINKADGTQYAEYDLYGLSTYLYVGADNDTASNAETTNSNTYIKLFEGTNKRSSFKISGTLNITVTSDSNGNILITGPDLSGLAVSANLNNYLPLSGGTLSNSNWGGALTINRSGSAGNSVIRFTNETNGLLGTLGFTGSSDPRGAGLLVIDDQTNSFYYTVLHSGNTNISNGVITINGTSITPITSLSGYATELFVTNKLSSVLDIQIVTTLPITDINKKAIYLMSASNEGTNDLYKEYVYINKGTSENPNWDWEILGTVHLNYSDFVTNIGISNQQITWSKGGTAQTAIDIDAKKLCGRGLNSIWGGIMYVKEDGVTEAGKYIDFHNSSTDSRDYAVRLLVNNTEGGYTLVLQAKSGTIALTSDLPTKASWDYDDVYLKLSGGTLSNSNFGRQLTIKRTTSGGDSVIEYLTNDNINGYIGVKADKTPVFYSGTDTSGSGYIIYHSGNLPAYPTISSLGLDDRYLKLTGGTLSGKLTVSSENWGNQLILNRPSASNTWGPSILFLYDGNNNGSLTMASNELYVGDYGVTRYKVYHTNNLPAYPTKASWNYDDVYVKLTGSTLGGTALFTFADSGNWSNSNSGVTFPVVRGGFRWNGQSDYIYLHSEETASDNLELVLLFGDDNSNGFTIRNKDNTATARITAGGAISSASVSTGTVTNTRLQTYVATGAWAELDLKSGNTRWEIAANETDTSGRLGFWANSSERLRIATDGKITIYNRLERDSGGGWINGRDNAVVYQTRTSGENADWHPVIGVKTSLGSWTMGSVGGETFCLSYDTDDNYNANPKKNTSTVINFPAAGTSGTLATESYVTSRGYITTYGHRIGYRHLDAGLASSWSDSCLYIGYGADTATPTKLTRFWYSEVVNNAISRKEVAQIGTNGLYLTNNKIWIQSASEAGGTTNRLELTSGLPSGFLYLLNKRGTLIYSNGIAFLDPYNTGNSDGAWIRQIETTGNSGILEIAAGDDGSEEIRFRRYNTSSLIVSDVLVPNTTGTLALTSQIPNVSSYKTKDSRWLPETKVIKQNITTYLDSNDVNLHNYADEELNLFRFFALSDENNYSSTYGYPCVDSHSMVFTIDSAKSWIRLLNFDLRSNNVYTRTKTNGTWNAWRLFVLNDSGTYSINVTGTSQYATELVGRSLRSAGVTTVSSERTIYIKLCTLNWNASGSLLVKNTGDSIEDHLYINYVSGAANGGLQISGWCSTHGGRTLSLGAINGSSWNGTWELWASVKQRTTLNIQVIYLYGNNGGITVNTATDWSATTTKPSFNLEFSLIRGMFGNLSSNAIVTNSIEWGGATWRPGANIALNASANGQEWSFDMSRNGHTGTRWHVWDSSRSSMLSVTPDDGRVTAHYGLNGKIFNPGGGYNWLSIQLYNSSDTNPSYFVSDCAIVNITSYGTSWQPWIRCTGSDKGSWALGNYTTNVHLIHFDKANTGNGLGNQSWNWYSDGTFAMIHNNDWLTNAILLLGRKSTGVGTDRAVIGVTNGNLHLDAYKDYGIYLNYYSSGGSVYFNGSSYYIKGGYYNGTSAYANVAKALLHTYISSNVYYVSGDTHWIYLGYLTVDKNYGNTTLLITSGFWGNLHNSADIINIASDANDNSNGTTQSTVTRIMVGGASNRTFHYKNETNGTTFRVHLYVYVTGGNGYGKWAISILNTDNYGKWNTDGTKNVTLSGTTEVPYGGIVGSARYLISTIANDKLPVRLLEYITSNDYSTSTWNGFSRIGSDSPFTHLHSSSTDCMTINTAYNSTWAGQLATDYRTNNIAYRAKNNGTWTEWANMVPSVMNTSELTNCNSVDRTGIFTNGNFSNRPSGVANWGTLFNMRLYLTNNLYHRQLFFDCYSTDQIFTRSCNNGSWTGWQRLLHTGNINNYFFNRYAVGTTGSDAVGKAFLVYERTGTGNYQSFNFLIHVTGRTEGAYGEDYYVKFAAETINSSGNWGSNNGQTTLDIYGKYVLHSDNWYYYINGSKILLWYILRSSWKQHYFTLIDFYDSKPSFTNTYNASPPTMTKGANIDFGDGWIYNSNNFKFEPSTNRFICTKGDNAWNLHIYSSKSYLCNCSLSFKPANKTGIYMIGLNADPTTDLSYSSLDYAIYLHSDGHIRIYESNSLMVDYTGGYNAGDTFKIEYVNGYIRYYRNNYLLRLIKRTATTPLYMDSSFYCSSEIYDLEFKSLPVNMILSYEISGTLLNLINDVKYSNGAMGSTSLAAYSVSGHAGISAGWYNYLYIPHRSGGVLGAANGDNHAYGTAILSHMTGTNGVYGVTYNNNNISSVFKFLDSRNTYINGSTITINGNSVTPDTSTKWVGTQAQYNAITNKDSNTFYFIIE